MSNNPRYAQTYPPWLPEELQGEWVWVPKKLATTMLGYPTPHSPSANNIMYLPLSTGGAESCAPAVPWTASPALSPVNNAVPGQLAGSPVEPLLESFNISAAVQPQACLEQTEQLWAISPLDDAACVNSVAEYMDTDLFSGLDVRLRPETPPTPPDTPSFTSSVYSTLASFGNISLALSPLTPASLPAAGSSPKLTSPAGPTPTPILSCPEPLCPAVFGNQSCLRKHLRRHHRPLPFGCPLCAKGHLDQRALARHLWARHPAYAQQSGTRSERVGCPHPGCGYQGRGDNVARHMKRHGKGRESENGRRGAGTGGR